MKIVIAAGGTAGHVVPALAVAEALRAEGAEVSFIGGDAGRGRAGARGGPRSVSAQGRRAQQVESIARRAGAPAGRYRAVPRARAILKRLSPDAVMGGGGYVAGPVGLAALTLRLPLVLTEADSHLGLTNRMLAPFSRRVCLAFPLAGRRWDALPGDGTADPTDDGRAGRPRGRGSGWPRMRPACWSSEAPWARARSTSPRWRRSRALRSGFSTCADSATTRCSPSESCRQGYDLRSYLDLDEFTAALGAADLVVARSGGSVFEIAAHGLAAVLVPYPHAAADHQSANARWMERAGAAIVISDEQLTGARLGRRGRGAARRPGPDRRR